MVKQDRVLHWYITSHIPSFELKTQSYFLNFIFILTLNNRLSNSLILFLCYSIIEVQIRR